VTFIVGDEFLGVLWSEVRIKLSAFGRLRGGNRFYTRKIKRIIANIVD